ncbi:hypothetical protein [Ruegeria marina]|uniref:Transmembrane protein (PGPGW) n=1 Tax=Ruegeria marina TaxID=639004 RepID=A0A1G6Z2H2_9RHOB|nr:hypothetical protein [Ruegeria marina]SDD96147.1 hypothetical protein SAMN04488239_11261 [Ruegeria marina]
MSDWHKRRAALRTRLHPMLQRIRRNVPRGLRIVVGLLLIIGGLFGFLPILGFWMIPLGVLVAAMDVELYRRWKRRKRRSVSEKH